MSASDPRIVARVLAAIMLAACQTADPEVAAICEGDAAAQLIATATPLESFELSPARGRTMMYLAEHAHVATHVGVGCGAKAVRVADGAHMRVARVHPDPDADDASVACLVEANRFFKLDLEGHAPPKLTAARLSCPLTIPSAAGVVVQEGPEYAYISDWWHYPEFPSRSGAVLIADDIGQPRIRGSLVYYQQEGQLQVHDLQTRTSSLIQGDLAEFALSDTHVLWREATGVDIAPMHLLELTTGVDIELGDFDAAIDNPSMGDRPELGWSWNFDLAGKYVLHVPEDPGAPREAFDLHGTRLPLPLPGSVLLMLASGHLLAEDEATPGIFATRPGDANTTRLDYPRSPDTPMTLAVVEDRLEAVFGDALHEVPLDGGPARLLVDDVGADRHWLDERHLATIFAGKLTVIDTTTGAREIHGEHATLSALAPDAEGLYFNVAAAPGDPNNGLWYLPRTALAP